MDEETNHGLHDGHDRRAAKDGEDEKKKDKCAVTIHDYLELIS